MIAVTVGQLADVLGAEVVLAEPGNPAATEAVVTDVVVDSRSASAGSLFVALAGERVDGHDFVATAVGRGAVAAVTARPVAAAGVCLVVPDPLAALGRLARSQVDRAVAGGLQVAAVTGSQGKTSTKDLLAHVLEQVGPTVAPYGNLNNELGVPLTVSRVDVGTRYLVAEMGARGVGHVAYLCRLAPPQVGAVLNVGHAHVGEFGSQQAIAVAKGELVESLPADGVAVLNADDPLVRAMHSRTRAEVLAFSDRAEPATPRAVWATGVSSDARGQSRFTLHSKRGAEPRAEVEVQLRLTGRHQVANAVAAAGMALALGVDLATVGAALGTARLRSGSRMELHERSDRVLVVNDAYNANPDSSRAAVDTLADLGRTRRAAHPELVTWAVLGDMLELGPAAVAAHRELGGQVARAGVARLVAVGEFAAELVHGALEAGMPSGHVVLAVDKSAALAAVAPQLRPGDTVLVKASRGLALDTVAEDLWTAGGRPATATSEDHP